MILKPHKKNQNLLESDAQNYFNRKSVGVPVQVPPPTHTLLLVRTADHSHYLSLRS